MLREVELLKFLSLLEQYKMSRKLIIYMLFVAVGFVIAAIVVITKFSKIWWIGLIFLGIAVFTTVMYFFIRSYLNKKIKVLEEECSNK